MGLRHWKYNTSIAGVIYLHLALWAAVITLVLAIYTLSHANGDNVLVPCAVLLLVGSLASFGYILFHEYYAHQRIHFVQTQKVFSAVRRPAYVATRLSIALALLWLLSGGWNMIIAARQPVCGPSTSMSKPWQAGSTCKVQRAGAAFSVINLLIACALFAQMATVRDPFDVHLLGEFKDRPVTWAPYRFSRTPSEKPGLVHQLSASSGGSWSEKPLPRTPSTKSRPPTPRPSPPDVQGMGLGISTLPYPEPQSPFRFPSRPTSVQGSPRASSTYDRTPPMLHRLSQVNDSTTTLRGFKPNRDIRRPPSVVIVDSAWKALHPPANHFRHVSNPSPLLRPVTVQSLASLRAVPNSPLLSSVASHSPRLQSGSEFGATGTHSRDKSTPYTPIAIPSGIDAMSASHSTSSLGSPTRKRGHVRCTSDPNQMISAHLAAEMDLAMRLDRKLQEVDQTLEAQRSTDKSESGGSSSQVVSAGAGMSEGAPSGGGSSTEETDIITRVVESKGADVGMSPRVFAKMEWDLLMGKEVML